MSTKIGSQSKEMVRIVGWAGQLDTCLLGLEETLLSRLRLFESWHAENAQFFV